MTARDLRLVSELTPTNGRTVSAKVIRGAAHFVNWLVLKGLSRDDAVEGVRRFVEAMAQKPRQAKAAPASAPAVRELLAIYQTLYQEVYGESLGHVADVEMMHLARLAREYAVTVIEQRLRALARYVKDDQFMARLGFKPSTLVNQWVRVTAYAKQHQPASARQAGQPDARGHIPPCRSVAECTERYFREARERANS